MSRVVLGRFPKRVTSGWARTDDLSRVKRDRKGPRKRKKRL